jgi:hypothetical protein
MIRPFNLFKKNKLRMLIFFSLILFYLAAEYFHFTHSKYNFENSKEEILIHFIHGSFPKKNCIDQRIRVGGLLGGHLEIEIDNSVYGFEFEDEKNIHIFSRKTPSGYNSIFTKKEKTDWILETEYDKITSIKIPVTTKQKKTLMTKLEFAHQSLPYDYSFFGMRCASSTYEDLSSIGIFPKKWRFQYIINAFYPRQLRKRMVRWANNNSLKIELKKGIDCRVWE